MPDYSKETIEDIARHLEAGTYNMSCYLREDDLYAHMKAGLKITIQAIAALREENTRNDKLIDLAAQLLSSGDSETRADPSWEADRREFMALFQEHCKAESALARPAPAQEEGEALVRIISAELHRLPNNNKGHEIGMMEVGYDSNGQLNYGPLWLSVDETDAILLGIYRALLARKPAELGSEGNPYKGTYNSVVFERHDSGLRVGICERDDGFEFVAHGTAGESSHYRLHPSAVFERLDRPSKPAEEVKP